MIHLIWLCKIQSAKEVNNRDLAKTSLYGLEAIVGLPPICKSDTDFRV